MLTPRQAQVCTLVAQGKSYKRVARELGISVETVDRHARDAAAKIPALGPPRTRCMVWFFTLREDSDAA